MGRCTWWSSGLRTWTSTARFGQETEEYGKRAWFWFFLPHSTAPDANPAERSNRMVETIPFTVFLETIGVLAMVIFVLSSMLVMGFSLTLREIVEPLKNLWLTPRSHAPYAFARPV